MKCRVSQFIVPARIHAVSRLLPATDRHLYLSLILTSDKVLTRPVVLLDSDSIGYTISSFIDIIMKDDIYVVLIYFRLQQAAIFDFTSLHMARKIFIYQLAPFRRPTTLSYEWKKQFGYMRTNKIMVSFSTLYLLFTSIICIYEPRANNHCCC